MARELEDTEDPEDSEGDEGAAHLVIVGHGQTHVVGHDRNKVWRNSQ